MQPSLSGEASITMPEPIDTDVQSVDQKESLAADYRLARRCADGQVAAWEELYHRYHDRLLESIRVMLSGQHTDPSLAEEIAARVWYALVENDGKLLLKYNPKRGASLMTYIRILAKDRLRRYFRSERRRQDRERAVMDSRPSSHSSELDQNISTLDEFLETLSVTERTFYDQCLQSFPGADGAGGLSCSQASRPRTGRGRGDRQGRRTAWRRVAHHASQWCACACSVCPRDVRVRHDGRKRWPARAAQAVCPKTPTGSYVRCHERKLVDSVRTGVQSPEGAKDS